MENKTVWLLWLQGWDNPPWLVRQVAESWEANNPGWNIEYLTLQNVREYVRDIDYIYDESKEIIPQHKADIIRLSLLKNYGGVWADATMLCMQPLDTWVEEAVMPAGLWMYHGHGGEMSCKHGPAIWLIVSERESLLISKWKDACDRYWKARSVADSYFWLDRSFKNLIESDPEFRNRWHLAPHLYCESKGQSHSLAYHYTMEGSDPELKQILTDSPPYALKFWWKPWQTIFPNPESAECQNSNGYFAIQMSKRGFAFKHRMDSKGALSFKMKALIWDMKYFFKLLPKKLLKNLPPHLRSSIKRLAGARSSTV